MKQNRTSPDLFQVGEKRSMKRGGSLGEYRTQDPGEELAATPVGLWYFPWRKNGHPKLLPQSNWVFCPCGKHDYQYYPVTGT